MTKYDYLAILSKFDEKRYKIFLTLSQNDDYVCGVIFKNVQSQVAGASDLFLTTENLFKQWLTSVMVEGQEVSILDSIIIGFLDRDPEFSEMYSGDLFDTRHITFFLMKAWANKIKSINKNQLQLIYYRYIDFLYTARGQDFLYGNALSLLPDFDESEEIAYEDRPFYEQAAYVQKQLLLFKKKTLSKCCKTAIENCEMRALWDVTFGADKFTYLAVAAIVRKTITEKVVAKTTLYYHLKRLRVVMMQFILDNYDDYLEDRVYSINGVMMHTKDIIQEYLIDAKYDLEKDKYVCNKNQLTNSRIVDTVVRYCDTRGIRYQYGLDKVLIKLKMTAEGRTKKTWKLYIFKGGGYYCHSTGRNGFITDLIPKEFFLEGNNG